MGGWRDGEVQEFHGTLANCSPLSFSPGPLILTTTAFLHPDRTHLSLCLSISPSLRLSLPTFQAKQVGYTALVG